MVSATTENAWSIGSQPNPSIWFTCCFFCSSQHQPSPSWRFPAYNPLAQSYLSLIQHLHEVHIRCLNLLFLQTPKSTSISTICPWRHQLRPVYLFSLEISFSPMTQSRKIYTRSMASFWGLF